MQVRRSKRARKAAHPGFARALSIAARAWFGPEFDEDEEGNRVRLWGNGNEDWVTADDVRAWLSGVRVVELSEGREFVREEYVKGMVRDGYLRKDKVGAFYWVTAAAAVRWDLPLVMGCRFPK